MEEKINDYMFELVEISTLQETAIEALTYCENERKHSYHIVTLLEYILKRTKQLHRDMDYSLMSD